MHINWWMLALQAINVLVLIWLLSRFLYRPVVAAIAARQAESDKLLADASAAKQQAIAEDETFKAKTEALGAESERVRAEVRTAAEADRARLFELARQDAAQMGEEARAHLASDLAVMQKELEAKAGALAGDMAGKLVARLPAGFVQEAMMRSLIDRLGAMSAAERATLIGAEPLTIVGAAPVDEAGRRLLRESLAQLVGAPPEVLFEEDPALIGGCELHGPHIHIRNSWRADLEDMLSHLAKESGNDRRA